MSTIGEYIEKIDERFKAGISREHSYRGDLQTLLESMLDNILVTNEPARIDCGAPDYILTENKIPVGYMEAKDIGEPLKGQKHKEQFERYRESLPNLIITDYLDFHLYRAGEFKTSIRIADIKDGTITPKADNFDQFKNLIKFFASHTARTITSSSKLAKMMAGKARLLSTVLENALTSDEEGDNRSANNSLREQLEAFQKILIHDIDAKEFADIYAQTIAYGMFAARLHDPTLDSFSRQEAARLIPKTNPFLRKLFQYIAGYDLDERIDWIVDALADIFRATDVAALLKDFGKSTQQTDPVIYFYETFLAEFDPDLRKSRGVWYTPKPVVNFIVRAVDDILKDEFDLPDGLADTSQTKIKVKVPTHDKRHKNNMVEEEQEVHKVQILDPAAGTGTFLAEAIKQIYRKFDGQKGIWPGYVENHLIPRLNGFEILMASYAMAHLKLDMLLSETGYNRESNQRFRVYLTNSLEEHHPDTGTLFSSWLSKEANQANYVKRDTPVMVIMGNPPYSGESSNKGDWIMELMEDYKKEPGGERKLQEQTTKWINDDYVKFIRYGQHFIEKNGEGVLAFINPHGFLDNPTFRGMRWHLLNTFNKIYTIDLHGNANKGETAPDGSKDENVFDIQQGVSINLFIKKNEDSDESLGQVYHYDLYGKRDAKYKFLNKASLDSIKFSELPNKSPKYYMVPKNYNLKKNYDQGFSLNNLFPVNGVGLTTAHDDFVIKNSFDELLDFYQKFKNSERNRELLHRKFDVNKKKGWDILEGYDHIQGQNISKYIKPISYRPFDDRYIFYEDNLVWRTVKKIMRHYLKGENIGLLCPKAFRDDNFAHIFVTNKISEAIFLSSKTASNAMNLPLYLYPDTNEKKTLVDKPERKPNLEPDIVQEIADGLGIPFTPEKEETDGTFAPIDLLDYIYGMLHSPTYRDKYNEFLKLDYPRVPYPADPESFWQLVELGGEIRKIHLLEHPIVNDFITTYPVEGNNEITKCLTKTKPGFILNGEEDKAPSHTSDDHRYPGERLGRIQINNEQYFGMVPEKAWNFYIGGYQPAEKWLKARRDRELSFEEIQHYQKIIVALMETDRLMKKIDAIEIE